jgi:translation initiation factor 1
LSGKKKRGGIVYSTDPDYEPLCPNCLNRLSECTCGSARQTASGIIEIRREKKGRPGKSVTVLYKVGTDKKPLLKELQKLCGVGGTVKNGAIELQGDQRDKIKAYLEAKGFKVKFTGG